MQQICMEGHAAVDFNVDRVINFPDPPEPNYLSTAMQGQLPWRASELLQVPHALPSTRSRQVRFLALFRVR